MVSHYVHPRLSLLVKVAEEMFYMERGEMLAQSRLAPTISFRQLAMYVATEAGFDQTSVGRAFKRDRTTVQAARKKAGESKARSVWWNNNERELAERWNAAIAARRAAEERGA